MTPGSASDILERHEAFWRCRKVDRPLVGLGRWPRDPMLDLDWRLPHRGGELLPDMLDVDRLVPQVEAYFDRGGPLGGDLFWPCLPTRSVPWLDAIAGAPVFYSSTTTSRSIFAKPFVTDWSEPPRIGPLADKPLVRQAHGVRRGLAGAPAGRFRREPDPVDGIPGTVGAGLKPR